MKNKDYVKENKVDEILEVVSDVGYCYLCSVIGCRKYCKEHPELNCKETMLKWTEEENKDDLFPIGTIVEYEEDSYLPKTCLGYYNGNAGNNTHLICNYKENIGKSGIGHICDVSKFKVV